MNIIDKIRKFFGIKTPEEKLQELISKLDYSEIVKSNVDYEVKQSIDCKKIGINEEKMVSDIILDSYELVKDSVVKYHLVNAKLAKKFKEILTIEMVEEYLKNNILINNDYIIEAYQRFIDHNLEEVKKEDERLALELQDQYEDLDFISEKDLKKASSYDNADFDVYNDREDRMGFHQDIIPPSDEESDTVSADDESIEILDEYTYEDNTDEE